MSQAEERVHAGLICDRDLSRLREAVCIHVEKVYDSCRDKDCVENARVRFSNLSPAERDIINDAFNVKVRRAVVKDVITDIEPVPFKRGFFTVDVKFIVGVTLDFFTRDGSRTDVDTIRGEISFDKKVILFGSEGSVKIFSSHFEESCFDKPHRSKVQQDNLPIAKVEVAEPIALNAKIRGILDKLFEGESDSVDSNEDDSRQLLTKRVYVTLGLFSIIKLVRLVQLLIPAFDFCIPYKECIGSTEEDPCELFETIDFPFNEFFPPQMMDFPGALEQEQALLAESEEHEDHHHGCHKHHHREDE